jgi:hypothetical protein
MDDEWVKRIEGWVIHLVFAKQDPFPNLPHIWKL